MHDDDLPMSQVQGGSVEAFEELYDRYSARTAGRDGQGPDAPRPAQAPCRYREGSRLENKHAAGRARCPDAGRRSRHWTGACATSSRTSWQAIVDIQRKDYMDLLLLLIIALIVLSLAAGAFISPLVFLLLIVVVLLFMGPYRSRRNRL
jgi:hypothetical protein